MRNVTLLGLLQVVSALWGNSPLFTARLHATARFNGQKASNYPHFMKLSMAASKEPQDVQIMNAVEVAFEDIREDGSTKTASSNATVDPHEDRSEDEIKEKVLQMLALNGDGGVEMSSQTMRKFLNLSEQASIAFVRARDYLGYLAMAAEDRVDRDTALIKATVEYIRQRTVFDARRVLAAATETSRPLASLLEAAKDPTKRSNLTWSEGLMLLQSGVSPVQAPRRLESFPFNDLDLVRAVIRASFPPSLPSLSLSASRSSWLTLIDSLA